jgi:hypothetical protein
MGDLPLVGFDPTLILGQVNAALSKQVHRSLDLPLAQGDGFRFLGLDVDTGAAVLVLGLDHQLCQQIHRVFFHGESIDQPFHVALKQLGHDGTVCRAARHARTMHIAPFAVGACVSARWF